METYNGFIRTPADAILLIQACYNGFLPRVQKRLSPKEGRSIRNGSVFIWEEHETGLRRWTDGRKWSASRVSGRFLIYREMGQKPRDEPEAEPPSDPGRNQEISSSNRDFRSVVGINDGQCSEQPIGMPQLMKLSFSITSPTGHNWHLINYYHQFESSSDNLRQPIHDPSLKHICPQKSLFPQSLVNDRQNFAIFSKGSSPGTKLLQQTNQSCKICGGCYRQQVSSRQIVGDSNDSS
ncbi:hypothetical protein N7532_001552 [Penicillium argentinense]|uniref:Uncharacterized protein n=1 Tax=Penicillium argentinense TaxID=1131581 RepID=A0A9W9KML3_9EURO|nr:uncharacterized protein N7532_001552 [Penicillium argentinense]KAJ5111017.1 hypothetical protein N7532_001552 [Penicillium argentinense]